MATSLANDLQILYKAFALAVADDRDELIIKQANSTVGMLMLRILAGRLWEGRNLLEKSYRPIELAYESEMSTEANESLYALRSYFSEKRNLINTVRDKIGFHADQGIVRRAFDTLNDDVEMGDYFGKTVGDTLYYSAEMIHFEAIKGFTGLDDQRASLQKLVVDCQNLTMQFHSFVFGFVRIFLSRYLETQYLEMWDRETVLVGIPKLSELSLPYFIAIR